MERMLAGLATRRYGVGLEPIGEQVEATSSSTSKSAVSRKFVKATGSYESRGIIRGSLAFARPVFPWPDAPGRNGGDFGVFPELRTPDRQDPSGARQGGDRSRTLIRNYASGIAGLQSARSLAARDLVSHGPVPRRGPGRAQARPMPPTHPAGHPRAPRPQRGPALRGTSRVAHPRWGAQPNANGPGSPQCSPTMPTPRSRRPGAPTSSSSTPTQPRTRNAGTTVPAGHPDRPAPQRPTRRPGGTRHPRAHAAPTTRRRSRLLHPPGLERPHRSDQRPPRSPPTQRPRVPQPDQLPHPIPTALRQPRTLNPEEPDLPGAQRSVPTPSARATAATSTSRSAGSATFHRPS
jgi:hypothetical protein